MLNLLKEFCIKNKWILLLSSAVTMLYFQSFSGEFVWDDRTYFLDNDILPNLKPWNFNEIFLAPTNYFRERLPLRDMLYVIEYRFFGLSTAGYHVVSILLYLLIGVIIFRLMERLYENRLKDKSAAPPLLGDIKKSALFVTAFFFLHPTHVEAVAYISSQKELLYSFFSLLSVYVLSDIAGNDKNNRAISCSVFFFYLAVLSKLTAVATGALLLFLWLVIVGKERKGKAIKAVILVLLNIPVFFWTLYCMGKGKLTQSVEEMLSLWERTIRAVKIFGAQVIGAILPFPLSFGYPFDASVQFDMNFWIGLAFFLLSLFFIAVRMKSLQTIGYVIFFLYLFPVLQLFVALGNAFIYDRYLFLPVLGIGIIVERIVSKVIDRWRWSIVPVFVTVLLMLFAMVFLTYSYIPSFRNDVASTQNTYEKFPDWPTSSFNYAYSLIEAGKYKEALDLLARERTLDSPRWVRDYFLGWIALERGEMETARGLLEPSSYACMMGWYFPFPNIPLARVLIHQKEYKRAEFFLGKVLTAPNYHNQPVEGYRAKKMLEEIKKMTYP